MDVAALISGAVPVVVALIGWQGWQRLFGAKRETTEVTSLSQEMWFREFSRLKSDATEARTRADAAERRADANEAALREAHRQIGAIQDRMDEIRRELDDLRLRERVLVEALVESGVEPNGWVERRMREIESETTEEETP